MSAYIIASYHVTPRIISSSSLLSLGTSVIDISKSI